MGVDGFGDEGFGVGGLESSSEESVSTISCGLGGLGLFGWLETPVLAVEDGCGSMRGGGSSIWTSIGSEEVTDGVGGWLGRNAFASSSVGRKGGATTSNGLRARGVESSRSSARFCRCCSFRSRFRLSAIDWYVRTVCCSRAISRSWDAT